MSYKVKFILYLFCLINCPQEASVNKVKTLVNKNWLEEKEKQNDFLLVCLQKDGNTYKNTEKNIKIEIKEEKVKNSGYNSYKQKKIKKISDTNNLLKMLSQTYVLFEIEIKKNIQVETIYLYCSNINSTETNGMFEGCESIQKISVVVGDIAEIKDIHKMFNNCKNIEEIDFNYLLFNEESQLQCAEIFINCEKLNCIKLVSTENFCLRTYLENKYNSSSSLKLSEKFTSYIYKAKDQEAKDQEDLSTCGILCCCCLFFSLLSQA